MPRVRPAAAVPPALRSSHVQVRGRKIPAPPGSARSAGIGQHRRRGAFLSHFRRGRAGAAAACTEGQVRYISEARARLVVRRALGPGCRAPGGRTSRRRPRPVCRRRERLFWRSPHAADTGLDGPVWCRSPRAKRPDRWDMSLWTCSYNQIDDLLIRCSAGEYAPEGS